MGCAKNLVDSERLAYMFRKAGVDIEFDSPGFKGGDVVINTCGFISDAKEESIEMILNAIDAKMSGVVNRVFVMGCLSERYRNDLPSEMPEVDGWYGKFDWDKIIQEYLPLEDYRHPWERILSNSPHSAFVKISEGCNRRCAYCAIPIFTGKHISRRPQEIIEEVSALAERGTKDFNIIAQDLSSYGRDLEGKSLLAELINKIAEIEGVESIRLHYAYPADFPYDILPVMAQNPKVCKYLDIALQHISDKVLKNMRRNITAAETRELLARIRREVPEIHIRTTLMVGFPGEGDKEFEELCDFVREQRFERMGAFTYSEEDDTFAAKHFSDDVPQSVKEQRLDKLMAIQQEIASELNEAKIGHVFRVIVDYEDGEFYFGRTEFDSPEVDPGVHILKDRALKPGDMVNVLITGAEPYELYGKIVDSE